MIQNNRLAQHELRMQCDAKEQSSEVYLKFKSSVSTQDGTISSEVMLQPNCLPLANAAAENGNLLQRTN